MPQTNLGRVAFKFQGDYSALTTYAKYDVVFDGESSFVSQIDDNLGNVLIDGLNWKYLAKGNNLGLQTLETDLNELELKVNMYGVATGTAQAQVLTVPATITALAAGMRFTFRPVANNTGAAPTLNINSKGAITILRGINASSSTALVANDMLSTIDAIVEYDGTNFRLLNPQKLVSITQNTRASVDTINIGANTYELPSNEHTLFNYSLINTTSWQIIKTTNSFNYGNIVYIRLISNSATLSDSTFRIGYKINNAQNATFVTISKEIGSSKIIDITGNITFLEIATNAVIGAGDVCFELLYGDAANIARLNSEKISISSDMNIGDRIAKVSSSSGNLSIYSGIFSSDIRILCKRYYGYLTSTGTIFLNNTIISDITDIIACAEGDIFVYIGHGYDVGKSYVYFLDENVISYGIGDSLTLTIPSGVNGVRFASLWSVSQPAKSLVVYKKGSLYDIQDKIVSIQDEIATKANQGSTAAIFKTGNIDLNIFQSIAGGQSNLLRANIIKSCLAKGVRILCSKNDIAFNSYLINIIDGTYTLIKEFSHVPIGISDLMFDVSILQTETLKVGFSSEIAPFLYYVSSGGVGMYQQSNQTTYAGWELSYSLIIDEGLTLNSVNDEVQALKVQTPSIPSITLKYGEIIIPSEIDIAVGRECNLWWSSLAYLMEGDSSVYFETICDIGHNGLRSFRIIPESGDIGDHNITIVARDAKTRNIISIKEATIHIVAEQSNLVSKNILMIGDSRTWQSYGGVNGVSFVKGGDKTISTEVFALCESSTGLKLTMIGNYISQSNPLIKNLAYSGASVAWALSAIGSSCKIYCETNGLPVNSNLDYVTIMYGINDLSDWNNNVSGQYDISIEKVPTIINNYKILIDKIIADYPSCKILLVIEPTTCASQDGYGYWAGVNTYRQTHLEMELSQKYLRKEIINEFDGGKYSNNVIIVSAGIWCDRLYGFPYLSNSQISGRCLKTYDKFIECVHPFDDGYKQIADGIFSSIKRLELVP